jgi:hypothetical protein
MRLMGTRLDQGANQLCSLRGRERGTYRLSTENPPFDLCMAFVGLKKSLSRDEMQRGRVENFRKNEDSTLPEEASRSSSIPLCEVLV